MSHRPPVVSATVTASNWVTTAAAPSMPIATSSHSAGPNRFSRVRANSSADASVKGKNHTRTASAEVGKCEPPPGHASQIVPVAWAIIARPSANQARRSCSRSATRASTAAVAARTGNPA